MNFNIVICEDDSTQRWRMERLVCDCIAAKEYDMKLALSTASPFAVLDYLEAHPGQSGLYFLDVDLRHQMNGLSLAARIREIDAWASIVFVTTHAESLPLIFRHKLEAMDYIVKDRPQEMPAHVHACIDKVYHQRCREDSPSETGSYPITDGSRTRLIPFSDILFFTAHAAPPKMVLHLENSQINFYGSMEEHTDISPDFFRSHKSFVVNLRNIERVDLKAKQIEMVNGEVVPVSAKNVQKLLDAMAKLA